MIKPNFTTAALVAAGMLTLSTAAQATIVDLQHNDSGTITNQYGTAEFDYTAQQPTGTGVIRPFLRIQNTPTEQGYNTSGGTPFDDKAGPWTHDIQFSDLQGTTVLLNGQAYFKIMLDANEPNGANSTITLDSLKFYTSATGGATTLDINQLGTLRYDLGANNSVLIDASRNHGSGSGDMFMYIPASAFAGTNANDFVYMYVAMGYSDNTSEGGFEEYSLIRNLTPVPEMSAFFPIIGLIVAVGSTQLLRRRRLARISA
jgi:hypothetical protein